MARMPSTRRSASRLTAPVPNARRALIGAGGHPRLDCRLAGRPARRAARVVIDAATVANHSMPIAEGIDRHRAEIESPPPTRAPSTWTTSHRRTRIGLVPADADRARAAVAEI